jgi:methylated-DNA-protein-cysteine methyltransferase-like protein
MGPQETAAASWFYPAVYAWVSAVPAGRVVTYGQVAAALGFPRNARAVGSAMALCIDGGVPWQRVINARGAISVPGEHAATQRQLLEREGVVFQPNGCVDLDSFGWDPEAERERPARVQGRQRQRRGQAEDQGAARRADGPRRPARRPRRAVAASGGAAAAARVRRRRER